MLQDIAKDFKPQQGGILYCVYSVVSLDNFTETKPDDDLLDLMDSTS